MTAQLSRERLEEKLLEHIKHGGDSEEETMARMLLAGMDSEPVYQYWCYTTAENSEGDQDDFWFWNDCDKDFFDKIDGKKRMLYTAPPAPVAVPDDVSGPLAHAYKELTPTFMRNHIDVFERYGIYPDGSAGIQAMRIALDGMTRRAAMLKAGPVTGWIKCSERMPPENDQDIWLWNGSVQSGYIWNGDRFVDWNEEYQELRGVTHWMPMPLPAAPEQEV